MNILTLLCFILPFLFVSCQKLTKVKSYDHLVSYLASGADVRYYFNVSTCIPEARMTNEEHIQIPVFGGAVKLFIASKSSDDGRIIFSQPRYIDRKANDLTEEIETLWIINDTAIVFWGTPGFFVNITQKPKALYCNWTKGEGSVWIKETKNQKQITSFNEIKSVLTSGEMVRWVINMMDCKCPDGTLDDDCSRNYLGNTITDFKITVNGSISFSSSMTNLIPLAWVYVRTIVFGHIYPNNTANFLVSTLDPTTWQKGDDDLFILCPIAMGSKGAGFFATDV
uniref:Uncharacterized protein LOC111105219 n=1 Tax=Crassostrea virginica TaxID=6565 RepID=A0A8B8AVK1_CRAVI|nr:uncharacterized protein LOC111105219 [Crassostrea virginica]